MSQIANPLTSIHSLSQLPNEILSIIIRELYTSHHHQDLKAHLSWFISNIPLISEKFHLLSKRYVSRYALFTSPESFYQLSGSLRGPTSTSRNRAAEYIHTLDLQEFALDHSWSGEINSGDLLSFLRVARNLKEVLFSFALNYALSKDVINYLFFETNQVEAIDFSGLSTGFTNVFHDLVKDFEQSNASDSIRFDNCSKLKSLSFHDSQCISDAFFNRVFPHLTNIERLDLANIKASSDSVCRLPVFNNLTHLSLSRCNLTKNRIFEYFTNQNSLKHTLKWLNLESDYYTNTLTEDEILIILESLIPSSEHNGAENTKLQYLNLNGRTVTYRVLKYIKKHFLNLQALHIYKGLVTVEELIKFLEPPQTSSTLPDDNDTISLSSMARENYQKLKYINLSGNRNVSADTMKVSQSLIDCCPSLICFELSPFTLNRIPLGTIVTETNGTWNVARCQYRSWLYKEQNHNLSTSVGVRMKTHNGTMLINHPFIKYAFNKIEVCKGLDRVQGNRTWPVRVSEDTIYNEYALNSSDYF